MLAFSLTPPICHHSQGSKACHHLRSLPRKKRTSNQMYLMKFHNHVNRQRAVALGMRVSPVEDERSRYVEPERFGCLSVIGNLMYLEFPRAGIRISVSGTLLTSDCSATGSSHHALLAALSIARTATTISTMTNAGRVP